MKNRIISERLGAGLVGDFYRYRFIRTILSITFCPHHIVRTIWSLTMLTSGNLHSLLQCKSIQNIPLIAHDRYKCVTINAFIY